jgi:hypothetical protein
MMQCSLLSLGCVFGCAPAYNQENLPVLRALKIAQRRLRPDVRTKLLIVSSSRTGASLLPDAWRFVFLDLGTSGHCRAVTVAAKTSSEHPDTVEAFSSIKSEPAAANLVITQGKLVLDSPQILAQARAAAKLKGIKSAEYRLSQPKNGPEPVWTLSFFADGDAPVARLQVGAKTGATKILPGDS